MKLKSQLKIRTGIELAAMVDVVLLLVTYFLVNTTLVEKSIIKVQLPTSSTTQSQDKKNIVIHITDKNKIYLDESPITLKELPIRLKKIVDQNEKSNITIKGDKEASYQSIISVLDHVNQAGITHFNLSTQNIQ